MRKVGIQNLTSKSPHTAGEFDELLMLSSIQLGCQFASLSIKENSGYVLKSIHGFQFDKKSIVYPFWNYFSDAEDDVLVITDQEKLSIFNQHISEGQIPPINFYAAYPLIEQGEIIGIFSMFDENILDFTKEKRDILRLLANQAKRLIAAERDRKVLSKTQSSLTAAKKQLKQSEKYYKSLIDSAGDIFYELDKDHKLLYVNHLFEKVTGYTKEEAKTLDFWGLVDKPYRKKLRDFYQEQYESQKSITYYEFPIFSKHGERFWLGQNVKMKFQKGQLVKTIIVARDITDQKELYKKQDNYKNGLRLINYISSNTRYSVDEQLELALEVGRNYLGLDVGTIGQVQDGVFKVKYTIQDYSTGNIEVLNEYELDSVFSSIPYHRNDVVAITNIEKSELKDFSCHVNKRIYSYIGIPYYINGKKYGTVSFISKNKREQEFDENEIDFIRLFAKWIGFTMEREISKKSLLSEQDMMRAFATFSPAAVAMLDNEMRYIAVTDKWREVKHLHGKSIIGKTHYEVLDHIKPEWIPVHQKALAGESTKCLEDSYIDDDGNIKYVKWEAHPWYSQGNTVGGIIIFVDDITPLKTKEIELERAKTAAEKASLAKDQFLSTMSHEIRTPLNAVLGASHLLMHESPREDQIENLHLLKNNGEHLLALVNDILDFNKIEEGKLGLENTFFNLPNLLENVIRSLQYHADDKNISLHLIMTDNLPDIVSGDPTRISQVLINLVSNAIKFTEKGKVELALSLVADSAEKSSLKFEVKDTGIGISKEKVDDIFKTFTQADTDTTRKYGGSGLGLAITKKLLELMGTHIQVESVQGTGSNFFFELTLEKGNYCEVDERAEVGSTVSGESHTRRILLVEDNEVNRILATKFLEKWGIDVESAENGVRCLEAAAKHNFDLILMDLQMPEMDGYEATRRLRNSANPYYRSVPIIALTANAFVEAQEKVKEVGMNDFVTKPFNPKEFREKMEKYLEVSFQSTLG